MTLRDVENELIQWLRPILRAVLGCANVRKSDKFRVTKVNESDVLYTLNMVYKEEQDNNTVSSDNNVADNNVESQNKGEEMEIEEEEQNESNNSI